MKFPAKSLVPSGGSISAHIFENSFTGLKRNLFWSVTVEFKPIQYGEDKTPWKCSMTCDWITWPVRDWRKLHGRRLSADYGDNGIESSFYMTEHDYGSHIDLSFQLLRKNIFRVRMAVVVEFHGFYGGDADPKRRVKADVALPFEGVTFLAANLELPPKGK